MATDPVNSNAPPAPAPPASPATAMLGLAMMNAGLGVQIGQMIGVGVAATDIMNVLAEHLGRLIAFVEPAATRAAILGELANNLPRVTERHLIERRTTAGGIIVPGPGERLPN